MEQEFAWPIKADYYRAGTLWKISHCAKNWNEILTQLSSAFTWWHLPVQIAITMSMAGLFLQADIYL